MYQINMALIMVLFFSGCANFAESFPKKPSPKDQLEKNEKKMTSQEKTLSSKDQSQKSASSSTETKVRLQNGKAKFCFDTGAVVSTERKVDLEKQGSQELKKLYHVALDAHSKGASCNYCGPKGWCAKHYMGNKLYMQASKEQAFTTGVSCSICERTHGDCFVHSWGNKKYQTERSADRFADKPVKIEAFYLWTTVLYEFGTDKDVTTFVKHFIATGFILFCLLVLFCRYDDRRWWRSYNERRQQEEAEQDDLAELFEDREDETHEGNTNLSEEIEPVFDEEELDQMCKRCLDRIEEEPLPPGFTSSSDGEAIICLDDEDSSQDQDLFNSHDSTEPVAQENPWNKFAPPIRRIIMEVNVNHFHYVQKGWKMLPSGVLVPDPASVWKIVF